MKYKGYLKAVYHSKGTELPTWKDSPLTTTIAQVAAWGKLVDWVRQHEIDHHEAAQRVVAEWNDTIGSKPLILYGRGCAPQEARDSIFAQLRDRRESAKADLDALNEIDQRRYHGFFGEQMDPYDALLRFYESTAGPEEDELPL